MSSSSSSPSPSRLSRFLQRPARQRDISQPPPDAAPDSDPTPAPRLRSRSERPRSTAVDLTHSHSLYSSPSSSKLSDLPTRISGWFNHISSSTTDLSLSTLLSQSHSAPSSAGSSPKVRLPASLFAAMPARAVRYIFDTDSSPDKSPDPIWLLGIQHPGYEPSEPASPKVSSRNSASSSSTSSFTDLPDYHQLGANRPGWPPAFYADFTSRIWLTYRSHFPPIRDGRLADLGCAPLPRDLHVDLAAAETGSIRNSPPKSRAWPWSTGAEKGWTTDSGWGCMLRTGQSLLANSLIHLHLSRDWRRPPYPIYTVDYATYVQIMTWFFDTPATEAPFSVHRMALAGKELGKDVGQWFGPSTAAGAIKALVHSFPESGLSVAIAIDSALYQSDVYIASHGGTAHARSPRKMVKTTWGDRPVLLLLGVRLGIDRVNPIYYDTIKQLYTFPQSVGIAGGRPSSSYYFVGAQGNNLFYLDPHQSRHAIPLRSPPFSASPSLNRDAGPIPDSDRELGTKSSNSHGRKPARSPSLRQQPHAASPSSVRTTSSNYSYHTPISPSPLQHQYSTSSSTSTTSDMSSQAGHPRRPTSKSSPPVSHAKWHSQVETRHDVNDSSNGGEGSSSVGDSLIGGLDALQQHYATAYSAAELKTFHCEQVRKMPMSGLDPSMLIGFLCRDEAEWVDLKRRVADLPRTIFSIQDEAPSWPSDSDDNMGLESISDPEDVCVDGDEGEGEGEDEDEDEDGVKIRVEGDGDDDGQERHERVHARQKAKKRRGNDNNDKNDDNNDDGDDEFYDTRSRSSAEGSRAECGAGAGARASTSRSRSRSRSDTEEDPLGPITPGPGSRSTGEDADNENAVDELDVDDGDWVDPSAPSPPASRRSTEPALLAVPPSSSVVDGAGSGGKKGKGKKKTGPGIIPVVRPPVLAGSPSPPSAPGLKGKSKSKTGKSKSSKSRQGGEREKEQEHYLFPSAGSDDDGDGYGSEDATPLDRSRNNTATATVGVGVGVGEDAVMVKRMNTTRARDGGRTQSGGVKGVLTTG